MSDSDEDSISEKDEDENEKEEDQDSESEKSVSDSSDDSDNSSVDSLDEPTEKDIKISQLRRGGRNRVANKLIGLQSYDQMVTEHELKRMQDGLQNILYLHTPYELSSICGTLGLEPQQKAKRSIDQILQFASQGGKVSEVKITKILDCMWEGAMFEYLATIGHPLHSVAPNPRATILQIWHKGGIRDNTRTFTPHFVSREVQKRYQNVQSNDIKDRLAKLRTAQENLKKAEYAIVAEHDYTNLLTFFRTLAELRKMETEYRDYFIGELEVYRGRVESAELLAKMNRLQLIECEKQFINVSEHLNEKLAYSETITEEYVKKIIHLESDLNRLNQMMQSHVLYDQLRKEKGGNLKSNTSENESVLIIMKDLHLSHPHIQSIHNTLRKYATTRDETDSQSRSLARDQVQQISTLHEEIEELKLHLQKEKNRGDNLQQQLHSATAEVKACAKTILELKSQLHFSTQESWSSCLRFAEKATKFEVYYKHYIEPLILQGCSQILTNPSLSQLCQIIGQRLEITSKDEIQSRVEKELMGNEEKLIRDFYRPRSLLSPRVTTPSFNETEELRSPSRKPNSRGGGGGGKGQGLDSSLSESSVSDLSNKKSGKGPSGKGKAVSGKSGTSSSKPSPSGKAKGPAPGTSTATGASSKGNPNSTPTKKPGSAGGPRAQSSSSSSRPVSSASTGSLPTTGKRDKDKDTTTPSKKEKKPGNGNGSESEGDRNKSPTEAPPPPTITPARSTTPTPGKKK